MGIKSMNCEILKYKLKNKTYCLNACLLTLNIKETIPYTEADVINKLKY